MLTYCSLFTRPRQQSGELVTLNQHVRALELGIERLGSQIGSQISLVSDAMRAAIWQQPGTTGGKTRQNEGPPGQHQVKDNLVDPDQDRKMDRLREDEAFSTWLNALQLAFDTPLRQYYQRISGTAKLDHGSISGAVGLAWARQENFGLMPP